MVSTIYTADEDADSAENSEKFFFSFFFCAPVVSLSSHVRRNGACYWGWSECNSISPMGGATPPALWRACSVG
jgi:hypothetical protein